MTTPTPADPLALLRSIDLFARVPGVELEALLARARGEVAAEAAIRAPRSGAE